MVENQILENQPTCQTVRLHVHQIEWPDVLNKSFNKDILQWLMMDSLSVSTLGVAAKSRIHVMKKPKARKEIYWVIGGYVSYLQLLAAGWREEGECVLDTDADQANVLRYFSDDLHITLYPVTGGPVPTAAKAALLISLSESAAEHKHPLGVQAPYNMLINRHHALLKELVGFDSKAYSQAKKDGIPHSVLDSIVDILKLNKSKKISDKKAANSELLTSDDENK